MRPRGTLHLSLLWQDSWGKKKVQNCTACVQTVQFCTTRVKVQQIRTTTDWHGNGGVCSYFWVIEFVSKGWRNNFLCCWKIVCVFFFNGNFLFLGFSPGVGVFPGLWPKFLCIHVWMICFSLGKFLSWWFVFQIKEVIFNHKP